VASRYDLYHDTNFMLPPFGGRTVATVCDLSLRFHPETHPAGRVRRFETCFARRLQRVDRFLVLSRAVRDELCAEFGITPERVTVTPPGIDARVFHPGREREDSSGLPSQRAALPPRYLLYVGTLEPRKDLGSLITAYGRLSVGLRKEVPLLLAGPLGWKHGGIVRLIREFRLESSVMRLGYVAETRLADLYRGATAFVYPSIYEGFGLPVLEAMGCGTPVACSDIAALRELVGEAALLVSVRDPEALADAIARLLEDSALRARLAAAGPRQAAAYSWRRCADLTVGAYRDAAAGG
jgi:O-antigen biosynthesis alpha-1,3-rhamnosyltransferase